MNIHALIIDMMKKLFPPHTPLGIFLRNMRQMLTRSSNKRYFDPKIRLIYQVFPRRVGKVVNDELDLSECDILIQVHDFINGGLERVVLDIAKILHEQGFRVSILILGAFGQAADDALHKGFQVYACRYQDDTYKEFLDKISPKLVFSHYSVKGASLCAKGNIPLVQMIHNVYMWFSEEELNEFQRAIEFTTNYIVTSETSRKYSISKLGVPVHKCVLLPLGIDSQKIVDMDFSKERSRLRKQYSFSDKDFVFLSVAAINHQKNLIGSIKAFHLALEYCPQAKFVLVGPGYERKLLKEIKYYIKHNHLENNIVYAGKVPEAFSYYAMADAFINASFFEGGPLVLLEALACGLSVVTTDVGFAGLFKGREGIEVVSPPEDIFSFSVQINDLHSSNDFERNFAKKLISTYNNRKKPVLPEGFVKLVDKRNAYKQFLYFINQFINSSKASEQNPNKSWMSLL